MKKLIFLADIDFESSPKVRAELNADTAQEYADSYKAKSTMPVPDLFQAKGDKYLLVADGRHRLQAMRLLGRKACECEVHSGGYAEALKFAIVANVKHGLRRTNADKRATVESAVKEWPEMSTQQISATCLVSVSFVNGVRREETPGKDKKDAESPDKSPATEAGGNASQEKNKKRSSSKEKKKEEEPEKKEDKKPPEPPKDEMGFPLPKASIPFWGRRQEIQELMTKVSQVRSSLKQYQDGEDVWLRDLYNALAQDLDSIYLTISDRKPFAVCPYCEGSLTYKNEYGKRDCKACNHIGLVSKAIYDKAPLDLKAKRAEALK